MNQKIDRLYPRAPLEEDIDLEQRLEKKLGDVNSLYIPISNIRELITFFRDKNQKSKKLYKKHKTIFTILKSFDAVVIIATISSSTTLSLTRIGLIPIGNTNNISISLFISNW